MTLHDLRFTSASGHRLAASLYVPPGATPANPAPAVLSIHASLASRAAQSGLAIELARRGYVVLALDQPGHGQSDPPASADGLGGYKTGFAALNPIPPGTYGFGPFTMNEYDLFLRLVAWTIVILSCLLAWQLMRSPWGRVIKGIREDEDAVRSFAARALRMSSVA